jgi:rare lipoprotein A
MKKLYITLSLLFAVAVSFAQVQTGKASFYADKFEGSLTTSGEKYKHNKLTGAHKTLPLMTAVRMSRGE